MITREQARKLLHNNMESVNLRRHCYSVAAVMETLASKFGGDAENWYIAGLLHDADYEKTKDDPKQHTRLVLEWLQDYGVSQEIKDAILAHAWGYVEGNPKPATSMQWALYCCDELTGFIVAVTLVRPSKKIKDVTVENILSKWKEKSFAAGVHREQIKLCEEKLRIPLGEFVTIALIAMQGIEKELGL